MNRFVREELNSLIFLNNVVTKYIFGQMKDKNEGLYCRNSNSKIPKSDLNSILKTISLNFCIVAKWKEVYRNELNFIANRLV